MSPDALRFTNTEVKQLTTNYTKQFFFSEKTSVGGVELHERHLAVVAVVRSGDVDVTIKHFQNRLTIVLSVKRLGASSSVCDFEVRLKLTRRSFNGLKLL